MRLKFHFHSNLLIILIIYSLKLIDMFIFEFFVGMKFNFFSFGQSMRKEIMVEVGFCKTLGKEILEHHW